MNQQEYAQHVSRSAPLISRWCKPGGKLEGAIEKKGKRKGRKGQIFIRVDMADALMALTMDLSNQRLTSGNVLSSGNARENIAQHLQEPSQAKKGSPRSIYSYQDALIKDKYYAAALKKIKLDQENSVLVLKADVEKEAFEVGRQIRDALQNIPSRISATLSALDTEVEIEKILDKEIRQSLEALTAQNAVKGD